MMGQGAPPLLLGSGSVPDMKGCLKFDPRKMPLYKMVMFSRPKPLMGFFKTLKQMDEMRRLFSILSSVGKIWNNLKPVSSKSFLDTRVVLFSGSNEKTT